MMFDSPDSTALTSVISISFALIAALLTGIYFSASLETGKSLLIIIAMILGFAAVVSGMFSMSSPAPGMGFAVAGVGLGISIIVIGFLVFLLNLAHS